MSVSICVRDADGSREVMNLSCVNFGRVWRLLGMEFSPAGEISGLDLVDLRHNLAIVADGLRSLPEFDGGVRESIEVTITGGVLIDCSLRAGYFTEKIEALLPHVERAVEHGGAVSWS